jgi:hypothetical protein
LCEYRLVVWQAIVSVVHNDEVVTSTRGLRENNLSNHDPGRKNESDVDTKFLRECQDRMGEKKAPDQRASFVEMAGVEPASEERTIKPTTYIVLSFTLRVSSSDRQDGVEATSSFPLPGSKIVVEENEPLACLKSAPL